MNKNLPKIALLSSALLFVGCDKVPDVGLGGKSKIECSDPDAQSLVIDSMQKAINSKHQRVAPLLWATSLLAQAIRKLASTQLKMNLDHIRTSQDDPQSTKNFCKGTLTVMIPSKVIQNADVTREYNGEYDVQEDAYQQDIELDANTVSYDM